MKRRTLLVAALAASLAVTAVAQGRLSSGHRQPPAAVVSVQPDQVILWNQEMLTVIQAPAAQPATIHPTGTLAITQLAVYDAVNAIVRKGRPYLLRIRAPRSASPQAAAAAAARTALDALLPSQQPRIDLFYQSSLDQIGSGRRVEAGIRVGQEAAEAILAARANDGANVMPTAYVPQPGPGEYQLTPPTFAPAAFMQTAHVTPFVLETGSQFRPPAPPALTSDRYAEDFSDVKSLGQLTSATRTANQTAIGKFWGAAPVWIVWNQVAEQAAVAFGNDLEQNARMFALLDTTLADGAIALYDAKYAYHRWRPITAITATDQGSPNTTSDPNWVPLTNTASDPSYPGAHAEFSQAAATVLEDFLGADTFAFSLTNATTGITRQFESFSQAADEAAASRIFAGQHFRYDEDAGQALGAQVADFTLDEALLPEHHDRR